VLAEPRCEGGDFVISEHINRPPVCEVNQDEAMALPPTECKIINSQRLRRRTHNKRLFAQQTPQCIWTGGYAGRS
jgi:hypothetical protein